MTYTKHRHARREAKDCHCTCDTLKFKTCGPHSDRKWGLALGVMRDAQGYTTQALECGIMNGASRSLAARVEEHKAHVTKALAMYERDNSTVYFEKAVSLEGPPPSQEVSFFCSRPYILKED